VDHHGNSLLGVLVTVVSSAGDLHHDSLGLLELVLSD
jgi:hypothetical protein